MKLSNMRLVLLTTLLMSAVACQEKSTTSSSSSSQDGICIGTDCGTTTSGTTTSGSTTSGTTTSGTNGGTNSGTTVGGTTTGGSTSNNIKFRVVMSGGKTWSFGDIPVDYNAEPTSADYTDGDFYFLNANSAAFMATDSVFKARVKLLAEPTITGGSSQKLWCAGRTRPSSQNNCLVNGQNKPCQYTKASYQVGVRNIYKSGSTYWLGGIYSGRTVNLQSVGTTSATLDWSEGIFPGLDPVGPNGEQIVGYALAVYNFKSNNACLSAPNSSSCPEAMHPAKSCWSVEIELATDNTVGF